MAGDTIDISVEHIDDVTCIEFNDLEINIASVDMMQREIKRHVDAEATPKLLLDFHNVQYIPTPALGAVVMVHMSCCKKGGQVCLANLRPELRELFHISKLDKIISIADDVDQAMTMMGS